MASPDKTPLERIEALIRDCRFRYRTQPSLPVLELCDLVEAEVVRLRQADALELWQERCVELSERVERLREAAQNAYDEIASEWGDDDPLLMEALDPMREALVASPDEPPDRR